MKDGNALWSVALDAGQSTTLTYKVETPGD